MTTQKSFKRLVRTRMARTGESYTAARAVLLAAQEPAGPDGPPLATSDATIKERTGRGWEAWFDQLDAWGAAGLRHREIARRVAAELGIDPLAWDAQAITLSFERARGLRAMGEREDGFTAGAQRTVAVPVERLFDAVVDPARRERWLPGAALRERTATRPRSARYDWGEDGTRVHVTFDGAGDTRARIAVEHARIPDAAAAEALKARWRAALTELKAQLERGDLDA